MVQRNNLWDGIWREKLSIIWQCSVRLLGSDGVWDVKMGFGYEEMEDNGIPSEGNKLSQDTKVGKV